MAATRAALAVALDGSPLEIGIDRAHLGDGRGHLRLARRGRGIALSHGSSLAAIARESKVERGRRIPGLRNGVAMLISPPQYFARLAQW